MAVRVLVEPSDYIIRNIGDTAMLEVALSRMSTMWPKATIQVFTDVPSTFPCYGPNVVPLDSSGRRMWFEESIFESVLSLNIPSILRERLHKIERFLKWYFPTLAYSLLRMSLRLRGKPVNDLEDFYGTVAGADMIVANGMGGISDTFPEYATELLEVFRLALHNGARSAMVGQGMGPLEDPKLRALATSVLPRVDFISLREKKAGAPLLQALQVSPDRVMTTGDDAIELAFGKQPERPGTGLGINLRSSGYADVNQHLTDEIRPILHGAAKLLNAPLIPIPISRVPGEQDSDTIRQLMIGYDDDSDGGAGLDTTRKVIEQVHRCRVVIAGSYHAAVFALSSGIPAVGLVNSAYYISKFEGLADQFGVGCTVVRLSDPDLSSVLAEAIVHAWQEAESVRDRLLTAARHQVDLSHEAYRRISRLAGPV